VDASSVGASADVSREEFQRLAIEVRDLRNRISRLEQARGVPLAAEPPPVPVLSISSDLAPAAGRALLAIAGAYLLRALSELGALPEALGLAAGIAYAAVWLWIAGRSDRNVAARLNAAASLLILAGLLWEATVRLHAIPASISAVLAVAFAVAVCRREQIASLVAAVAGIICLALLIGSHALAPFTFALLAIAATAEFQQLRSRWFVAFLADAAVVIFTLILARGLPPEYPRTSLREAVAAQVLLIAIYGAGLLRRRVFSTAQILQMSCAFLAAAGGALYLTRASMPIAAILLLSSSACYSLAFFRTTPDRNANTFAGFAFLLSLAGIYLAASGVLGVAICSALSIGMVFTRFGAFHAPAYLAAGMLLSGVATQSVTRIWNRAAETYAPADAGIILISSLICYLVLSRADRKLAALIAAAICSLMIAALTANLVPAALVLALLGLASGAAGRIAGRSELTILMYVLMALTAIKILLRDFAQESTLSLVASLLVYGLALILLPRIPKKRSAIEFTSPRS